jgi:hypothetical protein
MVTVKRNIPHLAAETSSNVQMHGTANETDVCPVKVITGLAIEVESTPLCRRRRTSFEEAVADNGGLPAFLFRDHIW